MPTQKVWNFFKKVLTPHEKCVIIITQNVWKRGESMQNIVLIEFREKLNLSLQEMADKIGVSKSYYEKIEYGDRTPSFNFISKFNTKSGLVKSTLISG